MTDKELIKQEIEETLNGLFFDYIPSASKVLYNDFTKDEAVVLGKYKALEDILKFLDSLPEEPASEDLEEEIKNYIQKEYPDGMGFPNVPKIARHFAEWQKQKSMQDFLEKAEKYLAPINYTHPHLIDLDEFKQIIETYINTEEVKSDIDFGYYWGMYVEGGGNINNYEVAKYFFELGNKLKEQQNGM